MSDAPRIAIGDHDHLSRRGVRWALEAAGLTIVAEMATAGDTVSAAVIWRPDACLIDLHIPGDAIAAAREIRAKVPETDVVMLTAADDEDSVLAAIRAGSSGCLPKTMAPERLAAALLGVLAGEAAIPRRFGRRLLDEIRDGSADKPALSVRGRPILLTARESQVAELMRVELSTREIAMRLGISQVTVRRHVSTALRKLEAPDRKAAVGLLERSRSTNRWRPAV